MAVTFGTGPADVVADRTGAVHRDVDLQVFTAMNGTRLYDLVDLAGNALNGVITTDDDGRYPFRREAEDLDVLWIHTPQLGWWSVTSAEALNGAGQVPQAVADAANALSKATAAAAAVAKVTDQALGLRPGPTWYTIESGPAEHGTIEIYGDSFGLSQSRSSFIACLSAGCTWFDMDVRYDASGTLWCYHQPRLELTDITTSKVDLDNPGVSWMQPFQMAPLRLSPSKITGGAYQPEPVMRFEDALDEFAGLAPMVVEPKNQSQQAWWEQSVKEIARLLKAKGLEDRVAISHEPDGYDWKMDILDRYGIKMRSVYADSSWANNDALIDACAAHPQYAIATLSSAVDDLHLPRWQQACLNVGGDFYGRQTGTSTGAGTREQWESRGVKLWIGNHATYTAKMNPTLLQDVWRYGYWHSGDITTTGHARPTLLTNGLKFDGQATNVSQWMLAGDFAPLPGKFTLDLKLEFGAAVPYWFGAFICSENDRSFSPATAAAESKKGYLCYLGVGGSAAQKAAIVTYNTGASVTRSSAATPAVAAGATAYMRIVVDGTTVKVSQRDAAGALLGTEASYTDAAFRGGYLYLGANLGTNTAGISVTVKSCTVTPN